MCAFFGFLDDMVFLEVGMSEVLVGLGIPFCSWGSMHLV